MPAAGHAMGIETGRIAPDDMADRDPSGDQTLVVQRAHHAGNMVVETALGDQECHHQDFEEAAPAAEMGGNHAQAEADQGGRDHQEQEREHAAPPPGGAAPRLAIEPPVE